VAAEKREIGNARSRDPVGEDGAGYRRELHRWLVRRLRSREDANDLAQEAYLRYLQLPDPRVLENPAGYLFRIAMNLLYEWKLRRDRGAVTFDSDLAARSQGDWTDAGPDAFRVLASREDLRRVLAAIPETYRRVLLMSKVDGFTYIEIAQRLGLAPDTVLTYLARATACARRAQHELDSTSTS
jgi:RNA polymerase sigma-70 factor (ECF subfamily)